MNLDTLNRDELYKEVAELAREQGVTSTEDWRELVDVTIDGHLELGELDRDQDLVGLKTHLTAMWEQYRAAAGEESSDAISEDPDAPRA